MVIFVLDFFIETKFMQQEFGGMRNETKFVPETKHQFNHMNGRESHVIQVRTASSLSRRRVLT
jgi:hypothetical protein